MTDTPNTDEIAQFSLRAFKGIEAGLGTADPTVAISQKLEARYPNHMILVQAGIPFLGYVVWPNHISAGRYVRRRYLYRLRQHEQGGYDRSESIQSYRAMLGHTGATR